MFLLHSHTSLEFWWKRIAGVEAHIGGVHHLTAKDDPNYSQITDLLFTRQVDHARTILQRGGVAQVAADGQYGQAAALDYNFHGRRPFITGFAELALAADAQMVPVMYPQTKTGTIIRTLGSPLDAGDETMAHDQRVEHIISQYVALLSEMWPETPWLQMERYIALPN